MLLKRFAGFIILLLLPALSFAQNIIFSAEAAADKVGLQDRFQVSFTLKNVTNVDDFERPAFTGFRVLGGPMQSTQIINGKGSISITYVLQALKKGAITISPAQAVINGRVYKSNSMNLTVVDGSVAAQRQRQQRGADSRDGYTQSDDDPFAQMDQMMRQMMEEQDRMMEEMQRRRQALIQQYQQQYAGGGQPQQVSRDDLKKYIFIKVDADNTHPYVGQQVNVSYKVCFRVNVERGYISKLPSLNGFWSEDFDIPQNPQPKVEYINGVPCQTLLIKKTAVFPQQSGELELDAATAECITPYGKISIASPIIPIHVKPLPTNGQPESFTGAVGRFSTAAKVDKTDLTTDDVGTLTFVISGSGNIKLIENPKVAFPDGLGMYDPQIADTIMSRSPSIAGKKTFTYSFNPQNPGDYTIPSITFSYFDAGDHSYKTINTEPIKITVKEGKNYKQNLTHNNSLPGDINNITTRLTSTKPTQPIITKVWYWSLYGLPALAFLGLIAYRRRKDDMITNAAFYKTQKANKVAWKRLATARKLLPNEHKDFYEEISKAIWLYLSDKLSIPISNLSKENIANTLLAKGVNNSLIERTENLIAECEMALYSPAGSKQQRIEMLNDAVTIIGEYESILK